MLDTLIFLLKYDKLKISRQKISKSIKNDSMLILKKIKKCSSIRLTNFNLLFKI